MKVICIEESINKCYNTGRLVEIPVVGEKYTVINHLNKRYVLKEMSHTIGYEEHLFIPLSNIDETEMVREKLEKQIL